MHNYESAMIKLFFRKMYRQLLYLNKEKKNVHKK